MPRANSHSATTKPHHANKVKNYGKTIQQIDQTQTPDQLQQTQAGTGEGEEEARGEINYAPTIEGRPKRFGRPFDFLRQRAQRAQGGGFWKMRCAFGFSSREPLSFLARLVHGGLATAKNAVNKTGSRKAGCIDFIVSSALSTRSSQPHFGEQTVYINSLSVSENLLISSQFIERTKRAVESKIKIVRFQDNPG